jgi:hypothetical protein
VPLLFFFGLAKVGKDREQLPTEAIRELTGRPDGRMLR